MKNLSKKIDSVYRGMIYLFPLVLFFSYHPVITLGSTASMNLELSLPLIYLSFFAVLTLLKTPKLLHFYKPRTIIISALIPVYLLISCIWSANRLRAILTTAIFTCIAVSILGIIYAFKTDKKLRKKAVVKTLLYSGTGVSLFCILQCILDLVGVSRDASLLCLGCTYTAFGFPHPNGFAIEPQFMGNLLLAPALVGLYLMLPSKKPPIIKSRPKLIAMTLIILSALFLTFSRGAIYSFAVAFVIMFIAVFMKDKLNSLKLAGAVILAFIIAISMQGIFAAASPTNDDFYSGVAKSIHQLSLGKLDIRKNNVVINNEGTENQENESTFSGYVEESTDVRVNLTNLAVDTWNDSPKNILIGSGLGGAGVVLYDAHPELGSSKEIVQNEYASILLELGIVGVLIILLVVIYIIFMLKQSLSGNHNKALLFACLLLAYALTLNFFSGLPNALHIYLLPALLLCAI